MNWENVVMDQFDDNLPRARAGHCAVSVSILIFHCNLYKTAIKIFAKQCC